MNNSTIDKALFVGSFILVIIVGYLIALEVGVEIQQWHEMYGDEPIHLSNDILLPTQILHLVIIVVISGAVLFYVQYRCHKLSDGKEER